MTAVAECESRLAEVYGRRHCVLTGRGATALWLAYRRAARDRDRVLLPATMCLSPWIVAATAGYGVEFCDIDPATGCASSDDVRRRLSSTASIGAVVVVDLYGNAAELDDIAASCREAGVLLIEDAAQAFGTIDRSGAALGSRGDISVISFGHTKILDVGGGGAILFDDNNLEGPIRADLAGMSEAPPEVIAALAAEYRSIYYSAFRLLTNRRQASALFRALPESFAPIYYRKPREDEAVRIMEAVDTADEVVQQRLESHYRYRQQFRAFDVGMVNQADTVPWRFTIRVPSGLRDAYLSSLRQAGFDASAWYPSIPDLLDRLGVPGASRLGSEVVNLWVTPDYGPDRIASQARVLDQIVNADGSMKSPS